MAETARAPRAATYDDVLAAPEGVTAEILAGELHLSPRPGNRHQRTATALSYDVFGTHDRGDRGPGGWIILAEVELHLGSDTPRDTVIVPDLAGWRKERLASVPEATGIELVPDWACEILSPGSANARRDRVVKTAVYHQVGLAWLWLVDPEARTVEVYRRQEEGFLQVAAVAGPIEARLPPFDAVVFDMTPWWPAE